jgi:large subunit ribosomal protein L17
LKNKEAVTELFRSVSPKIADRPGGYTRIIRTGFRPGDNAEMCMIELVDFNEIYGKEADKAAAKKRTRRGGAKKKEEGTEATAETTEAVVEKPKAKRAPRKKADDASAE